MKKNTNTLTVSIEVTDEMLDDVMVTALEGGINYWAEKQTLKNNDYKGADYASHAISRGAEMRVHLREDCLFEESRQVKSDPHNEAYRNKKAYRKIYKLNKELLLQGCQKYVDRGKKFDTSYMDADDADLILQYSLFGDVIFG